MFIALLYLIIAFTLGTWLTDVAMWAFLGVDVFWAFDLLIAFFAASITIPLGIIAFILELVGVPMPMFQAGAGAAPVPG